MSEFCLTRFFSRSQLLFVFFSFPDPSSQRDFYLFGCGGRRQQQEEGFDLRTRRSLRLQLPRQRTRNQEPRTSPTRHGLRQVGSSGRQKQGWLLILHVSFPRHSSLSLPFLFPFPSCFPSPVISFDPSASSFPFSTLAHFSHSPLPSSHRWPPSTLSPSLPLFPPLPVGDPGPSQSLYSPLPHS